MSVQDFTSWMQREGKTPLSVAVEAKLAPSTIYRFLKGERMQRGTLVVLEQYFARVSRKAKAAAS